MQGWYYSYALCGPLFCIREDIASSNGLGWYVGADGVLKLKVRMLNNKTGQEKNEEGAARLSEHLPTFVTGSVVLFRVVVGSYVLSYAVRQS